MISMKKFDKLLFLLMLSLILMLSQCNPVKVYSDRMEGVNFERFNTFAWLPSRDTSGNSLHENPIVLQNLRNTINKELFMRGYEIDTRDPDILVLVHVNFKEVQELVQTPVYSSYGYYYPGFYATPGYPFNYSYYNTVPNIAGYNIQSVEFTRGTVVIDVIKSESNELIWRGWANTDIEDPDDFQRDMRKVVEEIFEKYPVDKN